MGLRNYQKETLDILYRMEERYGNFSTVVNLPTGAGKTPIAIQLCKDVIERGNSKVLWLADKRELLTQSRDKFADSSSKCQLLFDKAKSDVKAYEEEKFAQEANIIFATIGGMASIYGEKDESFIKWVGNNKLYVIYDEAHHIGECQAFNLFASLFASSFDDKAVKYFYQLKNFAIIGFTATVYRGDKFVDAFKAFFKGGYCKEKDTLYHSDSEYGDFLDVDIQSIDEIRVAVADINELLEGYKGAESVLVQPQLIKVDEFMGGVPPRVEKPKNKEDEEAKKEYLKNANAMKYLAKRILENKSEWGKLAVIVTAIEEARYLCELLGKDAILWTSEEETTREYKDDKNNKKIVKKAIDIFKEDSNSKEILITVHKFDEGVDVPNLDTLYLFAKTNSQIILRQRVGRVIRKNVENPDKVAKVIWQAYPEDEKYLSDEEFNELLKQAYEYKVQTLEELENDYNEWLKNKKLQLPAIMYRKPLQADFINNYSAWMLFRAEEVFGTEVLSQAKRIGFFSNSDEYDSTEDVIFVTNIEYEGYLQLQRLLQNDWFSMSRYNECSTFAEYAERLGTSEDELLQEIKEVCFYQSNATYSDSLGKKKVKRIFVRDGDIKTFFKWFISGKLSYTNLSVRRKVDKQKMADKELYEHITAKNYTERPLDCNTTESALQQLKEQLESYSKSDEESHTEKEYTELLTYGSRDSQRDNYQEMLAKRLMMKAGVTDKLPRVTLEVMNDKENDALCGLCNTRRKTNTTIDKKDWILYASALVTIPNRIYITQADVNEYENAVKTAILQNVSNDKYDKAVKECLLALGYRKNDKIIKYQCSKMKELPKLLQYVIYQKCYHRLVEEKQFVDNGTLHPECINKATLEDIYEEKLKDFGIDASQMSVNPVDDVIYDYRPYLKAVYYYQGIKPEFLCRMANDLMELSKSEPKYIIDGFGGSGAYTMNSYWRNLQPEKYYNDLGIMNTAFYRCIQKPKLLVELKKQIQSIIDDAFKIHPDSYQIDYLHKKYNRFIADYIKSAKEDDKLPPMLYWDKPIIACEDEYRYLYRAKVGEYKQNHSEEFSYRMVGLEDRLYFDRKNLEMDASASRYVERYFHVFMIQLNTVYLTMTNIFEKDKLDQLDTEYGITDVDLAVLFFFYNTLSHRHFYNDCTLKLIRKMMCNYEKWLGYGAECFKKVRVIQKDALKLLRYKKYNTQDTIWYLDIPYAETSSVDYVAQWFDMEMFVNGLSALVGNYIVSSRCNICLPNEDKCEFTAVDYSEDAVIEEFSVIRQKYVKELNVFSFFSSFMSKRDDELYKFVESLKIKQFEEEKDKDGNIVKKEIEAPIKTTHIAENKEATYILIPYTKMQEEYYEEDGKLKKRYVENSSIISEDYVRRMLAATHYSNIPVDIMVTDIDIDTSKMPIQPAVSMSGKESDSIFVLPTFKTGIDATQYMTEPLVIIMKYEKFMEVLLSLLYHNEWKGYKTKMDNKKKEQEAKDVAAMFRNMFAK